MVLYWGLSGVAALLFVLSIFKPLQKRVSFGGKNVVITGGSTGIGRDLALLIGKEKIKSITIIARTQSKLDEIAQDLRKTCNNVYTISCDVTKKESVKQAIDASVDKFGPPNILITCAGLATPGYFLEQDPSVTEDTMQVDFFGSFYASHYAAQHMAKNGGGNIVLVSSTLGAIGVIGYASYCPAKYAINGLAHVLVSELSPHNIRISLVYPPDTKTPGFDRENLTKPPETKEISAMSSVYSSAEVAAYVLAGIKRGDFHIVVEPFAKVFVALTNSITPRQYGPLEGLLLPILAVVGFVARKLNDAVVHKHHKNKRD